MDLDLSHPSIEDLRNAARKRIPKFAFEYLDSATGRELGLKVNRAKAFVYMLSGGCAGLAGVILASGFGAGQPLEGVGWELSAIASVVVGGTLLTGGLGSVPATVAGALLLGLVFNILNLLLDIIFLPKIIIIFKEITARRYIFKIYFRFEGCKSFLYWDIFRLKFC